MRALGFSLFVWRCLEEEKLKEPYPLQMLFQPMATPKRHTIDITSFYMFHPASYIYSIRNLPYIPITGQSISDTSFNS